MIHLASELNKMSLWQPQWQISNMSGSDRHGTADSWVHWLVQDSAHIAALRELDVAVVSPALAPGVLHQPVAFSSVVTDSEHAMIKVGATATGQDPTGVVLEGRLVGLNGNGH